MDPDGNTSDSGTEGYPSTVSGDVLLRLAQSQTGLQWGQTRQIPGGVPGTLCRVDLAARGILPQSLHVHVDCAAASVVAIEYGSGGARHVLHLPAALVFRAVVCGDFVEVRVTPNGLAPVMCTASVALAFCATIP